MKLAGMLFCVAGMLGLAGCASTDTEAPLTNLNQAGAQSVGQHAAAMPPVMAGTTGYVVRKGDTLYSIALEKGVDYHDLAAWNHLTDINHIRVGQLLQIQPPGGQGAATGAAQAIPLNQPAVAAQSVEAVTTINQPQAVKLRWSPEAVKQVEAADAGAVSTATSAPQAASDKSTAEASPAGNWVWPTAGKVISNFGGSGIDGKGIDIAGTRGQPVDAVAAGKVVYSGSGLHGYGKLVIIKHSATFLTAYAHNEEVLVKEGQSVTRGQQIATMGDSDADRVELHFEVRQLGQPVDPMKFLPVVTP
jgi:lipoprotein NlpD